MTTRYMTPYYGVALDPLIINRFPYGWTLGQSQPATSFLLQIRGFYYSCPNYTVHVRMEYSYTEKEARATWDLIESDFLAFRELERVADGF